MKIFVKNKFRENKNSRDFRDEKFSRCQKFSRKTIFAILFFANFIFANFARASETNNFARVANLGEIVVEGVAISKYRPEKTTDAAFIDLPLEKAPTTVDVLTEDFIREQNPTDIHDLLRFVPGVESGGKSLLVRNPGLFAIRGKDGTEPTLDGVVPVGRGSGLFMDPFLFDRVEIVKGPMASLTGGAGAIQNASGGGGSINLHLKSANLFRDEINFQENSSIGKHVQRHRVMIDDNEIFANEKAAFRLLATADYYEPTYVNQGPQKGARARTSYSVAPSFLFAPNDEVQFGLKTLFQSTDQPSYIGVPVFRGRPAGGYAWYDSSCARDNRSRFDGFMVNPWLDWQVTDAWLLKFGASLMVSSWEQTTREPYAGKGAELANFFETGEWTSGQRFMTSDFSHSASLSRNYFLFVRSVYETNFASDFDNTFLVQPDFSYREFSGGFGTPTARYGVSVQDRLAWKKFAILGGVRYDHFEVDSYSARNGLLTTRYFHQQADAVSPRGGVTFEATDWLIFFANVSQTRTPMLGNRNADGSQPTAPWRATQGEGGVRVQPVDGLWLSAAAYRIEQENTPVMDSNGFYYYDGRNTSRGAELSLAGDVTENWSILAMTAFTRYTDRTQPIGSKARDFARQPEWACALNTSYRFATGPLADVVVGGTYRFRARRYACMRGTFVHENMVMNPSHVFDVNVAIPFSKFGGSDQWTLTLGVRNLFGEKYFESSRHYYECLVGEPRTFEIGLRAKF